MSKRGKLSVQGEEGSSAVRFADAAGRTLWIAWSRSRMALVGSDADQPYRVLWTAPGGHRPKLKAAEITLTWPDGSSVTVEIDKRERELPKPQRTSLGRRARHLLSDGLMNEKLITQAQQHFEAVWQEPVHVTGMGRVTVSARRDRRVKRERRASREDGPAGCVAEFFIEVFSAIAWPFVAIWGLARLFKRRGPQRHAAIPSGPTAGRAYRVADALKQHAGDIAVVRGKTQLGIAELGGSSTAPTVVWIGRNGVRPRQACTGTTARC